MNSRRRQSYASAQWTIVVLSAFIAAFGATYVAWGNWIPWAETINNPAAAGWFSIGGSVVVLILGTIVVRSDRI